MRCLRFPLLFCIAATHALVVVLGMGQAATAGVFIPASAQVAGPIVEPGLQGFFYDRDDPPGTLNSLALADAIIASNSPTATFISTSVDYPNGPGKISFLPTLGGLLGVDAGSLNPSDAAAVAASPMAMRFLGVIHITEGLDIDPNNDTIDVRFALGSDDGARLRIGGQTLISIDGIGVFFAFPAEQVVVANFEAPGLYPVEIVWYDHFGGIGIEWYSSIPGGPDSGGPAGTVGIVPTAVLGVLSTCSGATPCKCGDIVVSDKQLSDADPVTSTACGLGPALILKSGVNLDFNGHTIRGGEGFITSFGVFIEDAADSVVIEGGTISGVHTGIGGVNVTNARISRMRLLRLGGVGVELVRFNLGDIGAINNVIENVVVEDSFDSGVFIDGRGNIVRRMTIRDTTDGIVILGNDNVVFNNRIEKSRNNGIRFFDGVFFGPGARNTVSRNVVTGSAADGIVMDAFEGESLNFNDIISYNQVSTSGGNGFSLRGAGHTVFRNVAKNNVGDGILVEAVDSAFDRNQSFSNGGFGIEDTTVGDGTADTANTYTLNVCYSANVLGKSSPAGLCR